MTSSRRTWSLMSRPFALRLTIVSALLVGAGFSLYVAARGQIDGLMLQGLALYAAVAIAGWVILRVRPDNRVGWLLAGTALLVGAVTVAIGIVVSYSAGGPIDRSVAVAAYLTVWLLFSVQFPFVAFILLFPDGRLPDARWRPIARVGSVAAAVATVILTLGARPGYLPATVGITTAGDLAGPLYERLAGTPLLAIADATGAILLLGALVALVARYRAGRTLLRQQVKWFAAGAIANVCIGFVVGPFELQPGILGGAARTVDILASPLPLLGAAAGVIRYRLWDIDVVLNRAAAVGILWLALSGIVIAVTVASGMLIAGSDPRVVVALVLALVASAALPLLRRRVEAGLARRFGTDRRGYLALRRLSDPDALARTQDSGTRVVETARAAVGADWAAVWLLSDSDGAPILRLLAATGLDDRLITDFPPDVLDRAVLLPGAMLWADVPADLSARLAALQLSAPAAIALLRARADPIGLLAIGQRRAEPIEDSDLEVLEALGREVGLLLQNSRLQAELEARLADLDRSAREVRASRARIVTAQDHERRRIEQDLHDGVQQQLVNLASRLRRVSLRPPEEQAGQLADLAGEAEAAVFALRELGRGIYPTILIDLGLPAALEAAVARVPMDTSVEIDARLANRRFGSDVEAAIYLVALEALTNAQKHAPDSTVKVVLGLDENAPRLVLSVIDDGPGIERSPGHRGAGIQNMHDRIAAVGGSLRIDGAPGAGTLIEARVPVRSPVEAGQSLGSASLPEAVDVPASRR